MLYMSTIFYIYMIYLLIAILLLADAIFCSNRMLGLIIRQIGTFGHDDWSFLSAVVKPTGGDF